MPYSALVIANSFLKIAEEKGAQLDPMKLQKLVYYAHGWYLALADAPLIDEEVQAWRFGPVIPSIYHKFKYCGPNPIKYGAVTYNGVEVGTVGVPESDVDVRKLLERIWDVFGQYTGAQLSNMTHKAGAPWEIAWTGNTTGLSSVVIRNDEIQRYFKGLKKNGE